MRLGIGTSTLRSLGRSASFPEIERLLVQADRLGVRVIDTSDAYGSGGAQKALARTGRRSPMFAGRAEVITKVGFRVVRVSGPLSALDQVATKVARRFRSRQDFEPASLQRALSRSLRQLDGLSVYAVCLHSPPASVIRDGRAVSALIESRSDAAWMVGASLDHDLDALAAVAEDARFEFIELPASLYSELDHAARDRLTGGGRTIAVNRLTHMGLSVPEAIERLAAISRAPDIVILGTRNHEHLRSASEAVHRAG